MNVERLVHDIKKDNCDVYCYGAGKYGRIVRTFFDENGIDIKAFIVTKYNSDVQFVLKKNIITINEVVDDNSIIIISTCEKYHLDIIKTIKGKNIKSYVVLSKDDIEAMERTLRYDNDYQLEYRPLILTYHQVAELDRDIWNISVHPSVFEEQLLWLKKNYDIVSFDDISKKVKRPTVVLTFDDGYEDFYLNTYPILRKYNVPATVFISTGNIQSRELFWWDKLDYILHNTKKVSVNFNEKIYYIRTSDEKDDLCNFIHKYLLKMNNELRRKKIDFLQDVLDVKHIDCVNTVMTEDEIKEISLSKIISIGAHTVTHSALPYLDQKEQIYEIEKSKIDLEKIISKRIKLFAYPFGSFDSNSERIVRSLEFEYIACVGEGFFLNTKEVIRNNVSAKTLKDFIKSIHRVENRYGI